MGLMSMSSTKKLVIIGVLIISSVLELLVLILIPLATGLTKTASNNGYNENHVTSTGKMERKSLATTVTVDYHDDDNNNHLIKRKLSSYSPRSPPEKDRKPKPKLKPKPMDLTSPPPLNQKGPKPSWPMEYSPWYEPSRIARSPPPPPKLGWPTRLPRSPPPPPQPSWPTRLPRSPPPRPVRNIYGNLEQKIHTQDSLGFKRNQMETLNDPSRYLPSPPPPPASPKGPKPMD